MYSNKALVICDIFCKLSIRLSTILPKTWSTKSIPRSHWSFRRRTSSSTIIRVTVISSGSSSRRRIRISWRSSSSFHSWRRKRWSISSIVSWTSRSIPGRRRPLISVFSVSISWRRWSSWSSIRTIVSHFSSSFSRGKLYPYSSSADYFAIQCSTCISGISSVLKHYECKTRRIPRNPDILQWTVVSKGILQLLTRAIVSKFSDIDFAVEGTVVSMTSHAKQHTVSHLTNGAFETHLLWLLQLCYRQTFAALGSLGSLEADDVFLLTKEDKEGKKMENMGGDYDYRARHSWLWRSYSKGRSMVCKRFTWVINTPQSHVELPMDWEMELLTLFSKSIWKSRLRKGFGFHRCCWTQSSRWISITIHISTKTNG